MLNHWKILGFPLILTAVIAARAPAEQVDGPRATPAIDDLGVRLKALQDRLGTMEVNVAALQNDILELKKQIDALQKGTPHVALKISEPTGLVRLVNVYPQEMTVLVNQSVYRLLPNETRDLKLPPGVFTYQVLQVQAQVQNRALAANQMFTVTVR